MSVDLDPLIETRPLDADAWRRLASNFGTNGRVTEALDAIAHAMHLCQPKSGQVLLEVSKVLELVSASPESTPHQVRMAKACGAAGFLDRAILHLEKALEHEPDSVDIHREIAESYWKRGRQEDSVDALHRVLWLKKDDLQTALLLAERLVELEREKSAMMIVRRIVDRLPPTGEAELRIGRLLRRAGQAEPALWRLEKAVALLSDSPHAHFELALAYLATGGASVAIDELRETVRLRPDWPEPLRHLAQALREQNRLDEALEVERKLQEHPTTIDLDEVVSISETDDFSDVSELSGRLRLMPVAELLQFLAQRKLTGILRVSSEKGVGSIEIYGGEVVGVLLDGITRLVNDLDDDEFFSHCQTLLGEMIGWTDGQIDFVSGDKREIEPKLRFDVAHLLLETMRRLDEMHA